MIILTDINFIQNQFEYMRKRNPKGEITLSFDLTKEQAKYFEDQGYLVKYRKTGFRKGVYDLTSKGD